MTMLLDRPLAELRLAIMGTRSDCLADVFNARGVAFQRLTDMQELSEEHDLVFVTGLYRILPEELFSRPRYGVVVFHESPLPEGRGFAPLRWTIENRRPNLTVTAFLADSGTDSGPIIHQHHVGLDLLDGLAELNAKRIAGVQECLKTIIDELELGVLVARPQSGTPTYSERRGPADSELPANLDLDQLWERIRVCDNERFPAFFRLNGRKIVLRYELDPKPDTDT